MAENQEKQPFSPDPSKEHYQKFQPGPSKEHYQKFQTPEWKSELPDIRMELSKEEADKYKGELQQAFNEYRQREEGLFGSERMKGNLDKLFDGVKELEGKTEKERGKIREKISGTYMQVTHAELDEANKVPTLLRNLRNPFPYDSRWSIEYFERLVGRVNEELRGLEYDKEGKAVLRKLKRDAIWCLSSSRIQEAMGPSYEFYYDGELQLFQLRSNRSEILTGDLMNFLSRDLKGLQVDQEDINLIKKTFSKLPGRIKKKYIEEMGGEERMSVFVEKGLREWAVEGLENFDYWYLDGIASAQKDLEIRAGFEKNNGNYNDKNVGERHRPLSKVRYRFFNNLLDSDNAPGIKDDNKTGNLTYINHAGEKIEVRSKLLNPFCMPRDDENAHRYLMSIYHILVEKHDEFSKEIEKIEEYSRASGVKDNDWENKLDEMTKKIIEKAISRINNWDALDEMNPFDRTVSLVNQCWVNIDRGILAAADMGWGWEYKLVKEKVFKNGRWIENDEFKEYGDSYKAQLDFGVAGYNNIIQTGSFSEDGVEEKMKYFVARKSELGSIYDNHDVTTVSFVARHWIDYDNIADSRSKNILPTIGFYRKRWEINPPYWKPSLKEFASKDTKLLNEILGIDVDGNIIEDSKGILGDNNRLENKKGRSYHRAGKKGKTIQTYGKIDGKVKKYIAENVWPFVTPWIHNPGKTDSYHYCQPMLLPTHIKDINYWRSVSLEVPSAKIRKHPNKSIWHMRINNDINKRKLSEMKWEYSPRYKYNWTKVNMYQKERWLGSFVTPTPDFVAKDETKHVNAGGGAEKERGKRIRLGGRGDIWDEGVTRATVGAQSAVFTSVAKAGVMHDQTILLGTNNEIDLLLDDHQKEHIDRWANTLLDMPGDVRGVKNYGGTAAQVHLATWAQTRRILKSHLKNAYSQLREVGDSNDDYLRELDII